MFTNLHHNLCEYGSLRGNRHGEGGPRITRTPSTEHNVLDTVRKNLSTRLREIAGTVDGSQGVFIVFCNEKA
ncbi:hypothetical protein TNCV_1869801 [Trichonephila clavipes]|nr:hypothetical protein TNCV_1869801 [Trichonephila clavipes]